MADFKWIFYLNYILSLLEASKFFFFVFRQDIFLEKESKVS